LVLVTILFPYTTLFRSGKFLLGSLTVATAATGLYYLYKNFVNKDYTDDFDEFDDDLEPDSDIEESLKCTDTSESDDLNTKRDYRSEEHTSELQSRFDLV